MKQLCQKQVCIDCLDRIMKHQNQLHLKDLFNPFTGCSSEILSSEALWMWFSGQENYGRGSSIYEKFLHFKIGLFLCRNETKYP